MQEVSGEAQQRKVIFIPPKRTPHPSAITLSLSPIPWQPLCFHVCELAHDGHFIYTESCVRLSFVDGLFPSAGSFRG